MGLEKYILTYILILFIIFSGCVDNTKKDEPNTIISQDETTEIVETVENVDNKKQIESCIPTFVKNDSFEIEKITKKVTTKEDFSKDYIELYESVYGKDYSHLPEYVTYTGTTVQREAEIQLFEETGKTFINKNRIDYLNLSNSTKNKLLGIGFIKIIGANSVTQDVCDISGLNLNLSEDNIFVKSSINDIKMLMVGESWNLKYGWVITINSIDSVEKTVWITLSKNGIKKDDRVIKTGETYESYLPQDNDVTITTHLENTIKGETMVWAGLTNTTLNQEQILLN